MSRIFFHKVVCTVYLLLGGYFACAQSFIYKHYDVQDGLISPTIHSIFQDKDGFLWIGTESALCRYDGKQFKSFTVNDGLPGNEVFVMFQDSRDRIWLGNYGKTVAYIYKGKIYNQQNDPLLKNIRLKARIVAVAEDKKGNIALCDAYNVYIIDKHTQSIKELEQEGQKRFGYIYTDSTGQFITCSGDELYYIDSSGPKYIKTLESEYRFDRGLLFHEKYIVYCFPDKRRAIFLRDTILRITLPIDFALKHSAISDSVFSANTVDGAFLFNINTQRMIQVLPGVKVTNILIDREKNMWIGTLGKGIYKISSQAIISKKIDDKGNDIYYVSKERDKIIVGNNNMDLYEYDGAVFTKWNVPRKRQSVAWKVFYHEKLDAGIGILAHAAGMQLYRDGIIVKYRLVPSLKHVSPVDKDHIMVSMRDGVIKIRKNDLRTVDSIWGRHSVSSLITNDSVLIGTPGGLFIIKNEKGHYRVIDSLLQPCIVSFMDKTPNNLIWAGTYEHGLYCFKGGKIFRHFTDSFELTSNNIRALRLQGDTVWLGTDRGLVKVMPNSTGNDFIIRKFSTSDGLSSNIINSIYADGQTIYLGTPEGLCYFNESEIETNSFCNLVLTGVKIGNSPMELQQVYSPRRNQSIVIDFSGISFRSEEEMSYRYRVKGADDNWRNTSTNSLEFTFLPYGVYELEIIAINKFGKESLPLIIKFLVEKPFYKTTWFIVLLIGLVIAAILFLYSRRIRISRQKQLQKLQQELKVMELEQMALRAQMNPHFIFNCINVMQQMVAEGNTQDARTFITSFSDLVRKTLDNATELFIPLNEEIKFLTSYFELERIRLEDRFSYVINAAGIEKPDQLNVPNMVIQPFVENAIRHGIRYKKNGAGFIEVMFTQQDSLLRCTITDNGIGRDKAAELKKELGISHDSKSTGITFKRIESLNTLTGGDIKIEIDDLKDDEGNAAGTKVSIEFHKMNEKHDKDSHSRR